MPRISIVRAIPWTLLIATQANAENVTELWASRYNGLTERSVERAVAMAVDRDGNVYVTGESSTECEDTDFATVKYDKSGKQLWVARFDGPALTEGPCDNSPSAIVVDRTGSVYVTGWCRGDDGDLDYLTIKYDAQGSEAWVARYDGDRNLYDRACAIALDSHENVIVTGGIDAPKDGSLRAYATVKYTSDGELRWAKQYRSEVHAEATALAVGADGSIYVTGRHALGQQGDDFLTIKYSANGVKEWESRYNGPLGSSDAAVGIALDSVGNPVVTGWSEGDHMDYATIKYDPSGKELWAARYNSGDGDDRPAALAIALDDSIVVTGHAGRGFGTVKYALTGEQAWAMHYREINGGEATAVAVDDALNIYVTGWTTYRETQVDYVTLSYSPTGQQRWFARYDSPHDEEPRNDSAVAVAIFGDDTIYVAGQSDDALNIADFATVRYFQFTGSCIGNERLRADCLQRCRTGAFEIAGTIKSQLPAGTPITFTLDGAEPRAETIRPNGKARTKWKGVAEGLHVVRVEECGIEKATDCCP